MNRYYNIWLKLPMFKVPHCMSNKLFLQIINRWFLFNRLRELENTNKNYVNRGKILSILKELERLSVIEFYK